MGKFVVTAVLLAAYAAVAAWVVRRGGRAVSRGR